MAGGKEASMDWRSCTTTVRTTFWRPSGSSWVLCTTSKCAHVPWCTNLRRLASIGVQHVKDSQTGCDHFHSFQPFYCHRCQLFFPSDCSRSTHGAPVSKASPSNLGLPHLGRAMTDVQELKQVSWWKPLANSFLVLKRWIVLVILVGNCQFWVTSLEKDIYWNPLPQSHLNLFDIVRLISKQVPTRWQLALI